MELDTTVVSLDFVAPLVGGKYTMTDLLRPILAVEFAKKVSDQRTQEEKERFGQILVKIAS